MKQVYQCDYCSHTGHRNDVIGHQANCSFNPSNKNCETCTYFDFGLRDYPSLCNISHPQFYDIYEDEKSCDWYEEKS